MSQFTKRLLFALTGLAVLGGIGFWNPDAQRMLGMFALGWMMMDIAGSVFPEGK